MIRNLAGQVAGSPSVINATTGAAFAGAVTVYVTGDGGTQEIGSVGGGAATNEGNGYYTYRPSADETNYTLVAFTFIGTGAVSVTKEYPTLTAAQVAALQNTTTANAVAVLTILTDALVNISAIQLGASPSAPVAALALGKLNALLDEWNAYRPATWCEKYEDFTLSHASNPYSIGSSSADFSVDQRPVTIDGMGIVSGSFVRPVWPCSYDFLLSNGNLALSGWASRYYYEPDYPNGYLYFRPIPAVGDVVRVFTRKLLAQVTMSEILSLPPGYRSAITGTLTEMIATPLGRDVPAQITRLAAIARQRIFDNNTVIPTMSTNLAAAGMSRRQQGTGFDYRIGPFGSYGLS